MATVSKARSTMTDLPKEPTGASGAADSIEKTSEAPPFDTSLDTKAAAAPPPHPLDGSNWNISVDGKTYGPYSGRQIKSYIKEGRVLRSTALQKEGGTNWQPAVNYPLFRDDFPRGNGTASSQTAEVRYVPTSRRQPKSVAGAVFLSFLLPGLGQLYNGEIGTFIIILILSIACAVIGSLLLPLLLVNFAIWVWSMINAYSVAQEINDHYYARYRRPNSRKS